VLELQGLSRRYGDVVALRIVLGVLEPDRGEVRWRGRPVDAETRRRVGYMPRGPRTNVSSIVRLCPK
jgi:ABC-type uncharacterized transport system ATPase subunit